MYHPARLPPTKYGGTERVVAWLARGLMELGHEVTLIAGRGTKVSGARLVEVGTSETERPEFDLRRLLPSGLDILHASAPVRRDPGLPWVYLLHGNTSAGTPRPANTIYLSADHAHRHGAVAYVHNGLDPTELLYRTSKADYDLFLGRLHAIKGWQWAVEGCRQARRRLVVAGGWRPSLRPGLRFVGKVGGVRKAELLAGARVLWMPALWDEPFGLTLIEALASGTPVLGTRRGALPEIVTPEVGRLGNSVEELVAALPVLATIDPAACRARVERHFHYRVMAAGHLRMIRGFLRDGVLPAGRLLDGIESAEQD